MLRLVRIAIIVYSVVLNCDVFAQTKPDSIVIERGNEIFGPVDVMPEFPGGIIEMYAFIKKNLAKPEFVKTGKVNGKAFLKFVVRPDGSLTDIDFLKGVKDCAECDSAAVKLIKTMPKWKPGMQNGKPVSVMYNLPINFCK
jgi:periplasmic protein TonB